LSLAKLRIGSHFDDHVIESSAQILDGGVASLEPLQVGIQPKSDVVDPQVDQPAYVGRKL
jgi:hypothetical protein